MMVVYRLKRAGSSRDIDIHFAKCFFILFDTFLGFVSCVWWSFIFVNPNRT